MTRAHAASGAPAVWALGPTAPGAGSPSRLSTPLATAPSWPSPACAAAASRTSPSPACARRLAATAGHRGLTDRPRARRRGWPACEPLLLRCPAPRLPSRRRGRPLREPPRPRGLPGAHLLAVVASRSVSHRAVRAAVDAPSARPSRSPPPPPSSPPPTAAMKLFLDFFPLIGMVAIQYVCFCDNSDKWKFDGKIALESLEKVKFFNFTGAAPEMHPVRLFKFNQAHCSNNATKREEAQCGFAGGRNGSS
ncbi:hypothetical protein ACP4OV_017680 [Aristida adscensionis]